MKNITQDPNYKKEWYEKNKDRVALYNKKYYVEKVKENEDSIVVSTKNIPRSNSSHTEKITKDKIERRHSRNSHHNKHMNGGNSKRSHSKKHLYSKPEIHYKICPCGRNYIIDESHDKNKIDLDGGKRHSRKSHSKKRYSRKRHSRKSHSKKSSRKRHSRNSRGAKNHSRKSSREHSRKSHSKKHHK